MLRTEAIIKRLCTVATTGVMAFTSASASPQTLKAIGWLPESDFALRSMRGTRHYSEIKPVVAARG